MEIYKRIQWTALLVTMLISAVCSMAAADAVPDKLPLAAGFCVTQVNAYLQAGEPEKAVKALKAFRAKAADMDDKKAAERGYTHYYMDFLLGNSLMMMDGKTADDTLVREAAAAYGRTVEKQPCLSQAWLNLAQCRYRLDEKVPAARGFVRGYDTADGDKGEKKAIYLYYAAACYYFSEHHREALDVFDRLMAGHSGEVKLTWKEIPANALIALNRNREALPWLEELAEHSEGKKKKQWQEVLLYHYLTLNMDKQAVSYARFLTRTDPAEPKWWKSLTHIHLDKQRLESGLQSLMIYGFLKPLSVSETSLLGDLFLSCDIPLEAARYYEDWIKQKEDGKPTLLDKDREEIQKKILRIANAYRQGGLTEKALSWADRGIELKRGPKLLRLKADLLYQEKRYGEAATAYGELAESKSHQGLACLMMGYAAWSHGDMETAAEAFERAVKFPGQKTAASSALAEVQKAIARSSELATVQSSTY